jgi:hypothetical protein
LKDDCWKYLQQEIADTITKTNFSDGFSAVRDFLRRQNVKMARIKNKDSGDQNDNGSGDENTLF